MKKKSRIVTWIIIVAVLAVALFAGSPFMQKSKLDKERAAAEQAEANAAQQMQQEQQATQHQKDEEERIAEQAASHVYSHRGSETLAVEHTFEAYDMAIAAGSRNIEQDLVISADGTLYVSHDATATRLTGVSAYYSGMTDSQIDELRTSNGEKILKLSEVFDRYGKKVHYIIELKSMDSGTIDAFRKIVDEYGYEDQIVVQCFQLQVLKTLEEYYPNMPKLHLSEVDQWAFENALTKDYVDMVSVDTSMFTEANCRAAHEHGKQFNVWTLDTEEGIRRAIDMGVDTYFTNDTALAIKLEKKYRKTPLATLFFASDYQEEKGWDAPKENLAKILAAAKAAGKSPDEVIICGDYSNDRILHDYQISPEEAISEIRKTVREKFPDLKKGDMLFVQGNHDKLTKSIAASGLHEFGDYLVYVLNTEQDFPWKQGKVTGSLAKVEQTAANMKACFDELIAEGETRPVIIAGHVPLHFTGRTSSLHVTGDNLYSSLIFKAVNEAAESLDIIYLFGHNHTKGWDCYLGQSCVYKAPGDSILIPKFTETKMTSNEYAVRKLRFTYMNAGYIGHCMNCSPDEVDVGTVSQYAAADNTLTGTICEIYKGKIVLTRFSEDGEYPLSSAGSANPYRNDTELIPADYYSEKVDSPQTIKRNKNHKQ